MPRFELVFRLVIAVSILLPTFQPATASGGPFSRFAHQAEVPTATVTATPEPPSEGDTPTPTIVTETATVSPTDPPIPTSTAQPPTETVPATLPPTQVLETAVEVNQIQSPGFQIYLPIIVKVSGPQADLPVGTLNAFPSTSLLDNFNRSNGGIGSNWSGTISGYTIAGNRLDVGSGEDIYWNATSFGPDQEVYVTLSSIDPAGSELDLLLKSQSNSYWGSGVIEILYDPAGQRVQVWTFTTAQNWVQRGADIPVTLVNGDQLGARATAGGQVELYRNGTLLATRDVTGWPYYANGGYIGLWFISASATLLDDFGGGTVISTAPTPAFSATPLNGTIPLTVTFANSSTNATSYLWNFGDGVTSTVVSPTHSYPQAGVYSVTLSASDGLVTNTLTRSHYIMAAAPTQVLTLTVNASSDDAWYLAGTGYNGTSTSHMIGTAGGSNPLIETMGWRFSNVPLSAGVQIQSARLGLVKAGNAWSQWQFNWYAEANGNPPTFSPTNTPENRPRTIALVPHSDDANHLNGVRYWLDEIKPVVQEVINRPDWASGQAMVILARADWAGWARKSWRTYDYSPAAAAQLVITYTLPVTSPPAPTAAFSAAPLAGVAPLTVTFANSSTQATAFAWNFGDGVTATAISPTHTYTQAGVYTVTLAAGNGTVTDTLTRTHYITVAEPVVANFSAFPLAGTHPLVVQFFNNSTGATSYEWAFGDDLTSTLSSPTHTYTAAGVYTVTLTAGNGLASDTFTQSDYMTVHEPVIAGFAATPLSGPTPLTVTFTNSSTHANTYLWDFGDGFSSTALTPTHVYTQAGVYTVALTAAGPGGSNILTRTDYITVDLAVNAAFTATPLTGTLPLTVTFTNHSAGASTYLWTFGDGETSSLVNPTHTYTQAGVYTVSLTAAGPGGSETLTETNYITVYPVVVASFSASPLTGTIPLTVTFSNHSTGATNYLWDFGDGITSTLISPTHSYTQTEVYTVTLTASDGILTNTLTQTYYITAFAPVVADFSASPLTGTIPLTVTFSNHSTGATDYLWEFGDGITSTIISPTHSYTQAGVYTVTLVAGNGPLTDTLSRANYITVTAPIIRAWQPLTTTPPPPIIGEHAMAYDSHRQRVVLYGGNADGWPYEDTTWEFDGTNWFTLTTTTSPPAHYGAGLSYDPVRQVAVLFGGSNEDDAAMNQTWEYTNTAWTQVALSGSVPPSRTYHSLAINPASGTLYLFGGNNEVTYYHDLWHFENGTWSEINVSGNSPAARTLAALTFDTANNRLLLFGGRSISDTLLADLWAFDPLTASWQELDDGGGGPLPRQAHTLTYDPATGNVVLVGGETDNDTLLADTWHYGQNGWTAIPLSPAPAQPVYHQTVYGNNSLILFSHGEVWKYE